MSDPDPARLAAAAAAAWPGFPGNDFQTHLEERGVADLTSERAADLFLAWSCGRGLPEALAAFDQRYGGELRAIALRTGVPADTVDEALQMIRVHLLVGQAGEPPRIHQYAGRSDLLSWLRISVLRLAFRLVKRARKAGSAGDLDLLAAPAIDAEARIFAERYQDAFRAAFIAALGTLDRDDRAVLRYRYLEGLSEAQVAQILGLHRVTVARRVRAARDRLLAATRERLRTSLELPTADLDSIMRAAHSRLGITLRRMFVSDPPVEPTT